MKMHECLPEVRLMCAPMNLMLDKTYSTGVVCSEGVCTEFCKVQSWFYCQFLYMHWSYKEFEITFLLSHADIDVLKVRT